MRVQHGNGFDSLLMRGKDHIGGLSKSLLAFFPGNDIYREMKGFMFPSIDPGDFPHSFPQGRFVHVGRDTGEDEGTNGGRVGRTFGGLAAGLDRFCSRSRGRGGCGGRLARKGGNVGVFLGGLVLTPFETSGLGRSGHSAFETCSR
jgi:hypothetical protein